MEKVWPSYSTCKPFCLPYPPSILPPGYSLQGKVSMLASQILEVAAVCEQTLGLL